MKIYHLAVLLLAALAEAQCRRRARCITSGSLDHPQACRPGADYCAITPGWCGVGQRCQNVAYCDGCVASGGCRTCYVDCCTRG
ncbi:hypothetical protein ACJZ2D_014097 [Fusarium nematophilum]